MFYLDFHLLVQMRKLKGPISSQLPSHNGIAIIFSFFGKRGEVCQLLQEMSHQTRAYCVKTNGLKGFVRNDPSYFTHFSRWGRQVVRKLEADSYEGLLLTGTLRFELNNQVGKYTGTLNRDGQAHGLGKFVTKRGDVYTGHFFCNKAEGLIKVHYTDGIIA